jgi:hypothetical protein
MLTNGITAIDGTSGKGKAILSFDATSTLGVGEAAGFETFSRDGGTTFSLGTTSAEDGMLADGFSGSPALRKAATSRSISALSL